MPYVAGGRMVEQKSPWRLSIIPELFWALINFFVLFFRTMINPDANSKGSSYTSNHRLSNGNDPYGPGGGGPQRRMGGFRRGGGGPSPPPMGGGG